MLENYYSNMLLDRRFLHKNPECGFRTTVTSEYILKELRSAGYSPKVIGKGGIIADVGDPNDGYTLLRADIDALPITEETELDFKSNNCNMHACGHDMHTAMQLCVARVLKEKEKEKELCSSVRLFFQPAEEILSGAKDAVENGLLEGVKRAYMLHVLPHIGVKAGTIIIPSGGIGAPSARFYRITLKGQSAHGGTPEAGKSVIFPIAKVALQIDETIKEYSKNRPSLIHSIGSLRCGRGANIIPDTAIIEGTIRSVDKGLLNKAFESIRTLAQTIAEGFGVEYKCECFASCPPLVNSAMLAQDAENIFSKQGLPFLKQCDLKQDNSRLGGSEDFAYIAERVPSLMLGLVAGSIPGIPLHNPKIIFDEGVMPIGAKALYSLAVEYALC